MSLVGFSTVEGAHEALKTQVRGSMPPALVRCLKMCCPLASTDDSALLLDRIRHGHIDDQDIWQVQIQARIAQRAHMYLYTTGLSPVEVARCHFKPTSSPSELVKELALNLGPGTSVCVLPEGPETIPYLS